MLYLSKHFLEAVCLGIPFVLAQQAESSTHVVPFKTLFGSSLSRNTIRTCTTTTRAVFWIFHVCLGDYKQFLDDVKPQSNAHFPHRRGTHFAVRIFVHFGSSSGRRRQLTVNFTSCTSGLSAVSYLWFVDLVEFMCSVLLQTWPSHVLQQHV